MLLTKTVQIKMNSKWRKRYNTLGYYQKIGEMMEVPVKLLSSKSNVIIEFKCDYCGEINKTRYSEYSRETIIKKDSCAKCKRRKMEDALESIHGVRNPNHIQSVRDKIDATCIKKYGTKSPLQNEKILNKAKRTMMLKYGVDNMMKHPFFFQKQQEALNKNGTQCSSKSQNHISNIIGGHKNYYYNKYYWLDIFFESEKVYFEYDGGGHNLKVKFGLMTQEAFEVKERSRYAYLRRCGLKMARIISSKNKVPIDNILISIKQFSFDFLNNEDYGWIIFDMDKNEIRYKNGSIDYNFTHTLNYNQYKKTNSL